MQHLIKIDIKLTNKQENPIIIKIAEPEYKERE